MNDTRAIWNRPITVAEAAALSRGTIDETLGITLTEIGPDFVRGTMPVDERTRQPFGLLHGGASVVLAESLGSLAAHLTVDTERKYCLGLDVNANHLRPVRDGHVTGTARPIHRGNSTQVWEIRIEDSRGHLSCIARLTMAVLQRSGPGAGP